MGEVREEGLGALHLGRVELEPLALLRDQPARAGNRRRRGRFVEVQVCGNSPIEIDCVLVVLRPHGLRDLDELIRHGLRRALEHGLQIELAVAVVIGLDHQRLRLSSGVASGGHLRVWVI